MPLTIAQFAGNRVQGESFWGDMLITVTTALQHGAPLYMFLYGAGIAFFCFFYTAVVFNPEETADHLKRYGGFIPGIRPGKRTEEYLDYVLRRITVVDAEYLPDRESLRKGKSVSVRVGLGGRRVIEKK